MESILHKRYKLGERLFSNSLGELFLGRDLQAPAAQRLLIHYLPSQLLSDTALKQSLNSLQSLGQQAATSVLKVIDCAWSDTEVFFVLEAPETWSVSVLPALQGPATNLHQKALAITQQLIDQDLISQGIEPSLFLVTPNGELYLLGTAFLSELQDLQLASPTLLQPQTIKTRKRASLLPLSLLGITGLVLAGGFGVYQFTSANKLPRPLTTTNISVSELDKPSLQSAANTNLVANNPEPKQLVAMASTVKTEPVPAQPPSLQSAHKEPAELAPQAVVEPSPPTLAKQLTQPELLISNSLNAQEASPSQTTDPAVLKHLEHASEAINHGHLQTGLYYLRLAKKLGANLAPLQANAKQLIAQAQQNTATNEALSSQMQESIKLEFGLK